MSSNTVALITGANKGIGFEIARQLARRGITVLAGARDKIRGEEAVERLRKEGATVHLILIEQTAEDTINAAVEEVDRRFGRLDVLINNAAILIDQGGRAATLDDDVLTRTLATNVNGVVNVTRAFLPLIRKSEAGRIVNMSSSGGSLAQISEGVQNFAPAYQISKAALNAFTVLLAKELADTRIKVNSACPGWVKTDMGGPGAPGTVEEGADTPVWLATLPAAGPTGGFFNSRKPVAW